MKTTISQKKIPRKKLMELYGISKSKILQLEGEGILIPQYFNQNSRLAFYDVEQVEKALKPVHLGDHVVKISKNTERRES